MSQTRSCHWVLLCLSSPLLVACSVQPCVVSHCVYLTLSDVAYCCFFPVVIAAVPVTGNVLACLPTPLSALTFVIIAFNVASVATFWSFLSLHCHPHRRSLPRFPFHRFCTAINPRFVHFSSTVTYCHVFTAPCCYSNGAVMPSLDVRLSVCPTVRPSVTLVFPDHIRWGRFSFITRLISPMSSLAARQISAI